MKLMLLGLCLSLFGTLCFAEGTFQIRSNDPQGMYIIDGVKVYFCKDGNDCSQLTEDYRKLKQQDQKESINEEVGNKENDAS
jgi:hypothetical protein